MSRRVTSFAERAAARRLPSVLYVGADLVDRSAVEQVFAELGLAVRWVNGRPATLTALEDQALPLCLLDMSGDNDATGLAGLIRRHRPDALLVAVVDAAHAELVDEAKRAGVAEVLSWPLSVSGIAGIVEMARDRARSATEGLLTQPVESAPYGMFGRSQAMRQVMEHVRNAAIRDGGVLIIGESGTGREMIARAIHAHSVRPEAPFVKIDCAAAAPHELEQQLFGLIATRREDLGERRSTERVTDTSLIYLARGGVVFLENLTALPGRMQARLVRAVRDGEVRLVDESGGPTRGTVIELGIRLMAAVEPSFDAALNEGRIRAELNERLSGTRIELPPFRRRREDIPALAMYFMADACRDLGTSPKTFTRSAMTLLSALPWRENAHELRDLLSRLAAHVSHHLIRLEDVLANVRLDGNAAPSTNPGGTLKQARTRFEREYITAVLQQQRGRVGEAARVLGIQRTNLYRKVRQLNIPLPKTSIKDL